MFHSIRQNFADCKGKIFPGLAGQNPAMPIDYRKCLSENLNALMTWSGQSAATVKAVYAAGPKKGEFVSERTVRNIVRNPSESSGISVDGLGALAAALGVEAYHLLVPGLDPITQPVTRAENWIEAEVQRRLAARLRRAGPLLKTLEASSEETAKTKRPSARDPWPDTKIPAGGSERKTAEAKKRRQKDRAK